MPVVYVLRPYPKCSTYVNISQIIITSTSYPFKKLMCAIKKYIIIDVELITYNGVSVVWICIMKKTDA